jgi:endonuclease/exonuclease/phosphatase family metal-dependent hydrolase
MAKATLSLMFSMFTLVLCLAPEQALAQITDEPKAEASQPSDATAASNRGLKVMTWNLRAGAGCDLVSERYLDAVEAEIRRHKKLDVIALQEVHRVQANRLAVHLGFFLHFVQMRGCDNNARDFGIAILSRRYFGVNGKEKELTNFSCDSVKRMVASITVRIRGRLVHIYATHLTACGGPEGQAKQVREILDFIDQDRNSPRRRGKFRPILLGDFNAKPFDAPYFIVTNDFKDAWEEGGHPTLFNPDGDTFQTTALEARIDYVFLGWESGLKAEDVKVTDPETLFRIFNTRDSKKLPDHLPVIARLSYE